MACEPLTGVLLRTLAASKPGGRFLEIGTGTGIGTCWILDGMDAASTLLTLELNEAVHCIAHEHLSGDPRVQFVLANAEQFLTSPDDRQFDFIFADTFPGKFYLRDEMLSRLRPGGLYIIDDLLPQPNWPENHQSNVDTLITALNTRSDLATTYLDWASGLIVAVKRSV